MIYFSILCRFQYIVIYLLKFKWVIGLLNLKTPYFGENPSHKLILAIIEPCILAYYHIISCAFVDPVGVIQSDFIKIIGVSKL